MQSLSYPTETVLTDKIPRNRIVLSFKDSPYRKPLGWPPFGVFFEHLAPSVRTSYMDAPLVGFFASPKERSQSIGAAVVVWQLPLPFQYLLPRECRRRQCFAEISAAAAAAPLHAILLLYFERERPISLSSGRGRRRERAWQATDHRLLSVNPSGQNNTGCFNVTYKGNIILDGWLQHFSYHENALSLAEFFFAKM